MTEAFPPAIGFRLRGTEPAPPELSALQLSFESAIPFSELEHLLAARSDSYAMMQSAWREGYLEILDNIGSPNLVGYSSSTLSLDLWAIERLSRWRLSRFALMRRESGDQLILESARTGGKATIHGSAMMLAYHELRKARTIEELDAAVPSLGGNGAGVLFVLRATGIVVTCDEGHDSEERDEHLTQWELHDMFLHTQSRLARADQRIGPYRFRGQLPPQPAIKPNPWADKSLELPRVDLQALLGKDPPFTTVLEGRRSVRVDSTSQPISLDQVSEFLFRVARIRDTSTNGLGEFTTRPYPSGGACYELELYLAINDCRGLSRGFYYYDALRHAISNVSAPAGELNELLADAWSATGEQYVPQVLILIASRFARVAWKYAGTAYATQLKDVGVVMQTMYLVATAMGLAPCALGLGDATRFSRLTKLDPFQEGSVGEFLLGAG